MIQILSTDRTFRSTQPGGEPVEGVFVEGWIPLTEAADLLTRYDSSSGTSPAVTDARTIARPFLDALKTDLEG